MPNVLFVSPHLDDVAFSCAGTLMRFLGAGWGATLCTVFTRSVPDPQGFALRCQTDKGLAADIDYMALRRAEDAEFARLAGVRDVRHWPFAEAPHRGYESPAALFAGVQDGDDIWRSIADALTALADELRPNMVFGPQGLGGHADHLQVIRALIESGLAERTAWYRDTPYALREPDARPSPLLPTGLQEQALDITGLLDRKIAGCCAYASQIGFQFGGPDGVRRKLTDFHREEAAHSGLSGCAERLRMPAHILSLGGAFRPLAE